MAKTKSKTLTSSVVSIDRNAPRYFKGDVVTGDALKYCEKAGASFVEVAKKEEEEEAK